MSNDTGDKRLLPARDHRFTFSVCQQYHWSGWRQQTLKRDRRSRAGGRHAKKTTVLGIDYLGREIPLEMALNHLHWPSLRRSPQCRKACSSRWRCHGVEQTTESLSCSALTSRYLPLLLRCGAAAAAPANSTQRATVIKCLT